MDEVHNEKLSVNRQALMDSFLKAEGVTLDEQPDGGSDKPPANLDNALTQSKSGEETPVKTPAADVVTDTGDVVKVEKTEEPKLVPLQALHEAREKQKAAILKQRKLADDLAARDIALKEATDRAERVEREYQRLLKGEDAPNETEATRQLAEENKKLKDEQKRLADKAIVDAKVKADADMAKLVADADVSLTAQGYPGFRRFTVDVGNAIIAKIQAGDLEEADVNPALWATVYREEVYPSIKSLFAKQVKQEELDAKLQLKKETTLVPVHGEPPLPIEEADLDAPQTPESYMKARKRII